MIIKVTQEHIDKGQTTDCYFCPIAIAVREAINNEMVTVEVGNLYVDLDTKDASGRILLPEVAKKFVVRFDHNAPVEPFEFELPLNEADIKEFNHDSF